MQQFARAMIGLGEIFNEPVSPSRIEAYWTILQHHGEDKLIQAIGQAAAVCDFFPRPARLIRLIEDGPRARADIEPEATSTWGRIQSMCSDRAAVQSLANGDPRTKAGLDALGGWGGMVNSTEAVGWLASRFVKAYIGKEQRQAKEVPQIESAPVADLISGIGVES